MSLTKKLKDWDIEILDGDRSSRYPKRNEMIGTGVLFLSTPAIVDGGINYDAANFITEQKFNEIKKGRLVENDIVMTTRGTIGKLAFFRPTQVHPTGLINAQMIILRANPQVINPRFLFYLMGSDTYQNEMKNFSSGSAQPQIPISDLRETELTIPPLNKQNEVVRVIDAYARLIENNNRRIEILETIAQKLYQEWFIHYRFPGHEQTQWQNTGQGKIPAGWEFRRLKDVCNLTMGQSPKSEFYNELGEGVPFFQGVRDFGQRFPTASVWCTKPARFAKKDDILFSVRAPVGRLNIAGFDLSIGRGLCAINHKEGYQAFLYQQIKSIFTKEDMMGGGTIFNSVTKNDMENIQLICPPISIVKEMDKLLQPIFKSLDNLSLKNQNLKQQRDLLLPKLIKG